MSCSRPIKTAFDTILLIFITLLSVSALAQKENSQPASAKNKFNETQAACKKGDMAKCNELGDMFANGIGVATDEKQAIVLYQQACEGENYAGCFKIGLAYISGVGTEKDADKAYAYFVEACSGEVGIGCMNAGLVLARGSETAQTKKQVSELFGKACQLGDVDGCLNLGADYFNGTGVARNYKQAAHFFEISCEAGSSKGCTNIAAMLQNGYETGIDSGRLKSMFQEQCRSGHRDVCESLALLYLEGKGVEKDMDGALRFLQFACDDGSLSSCYRLGAILANGDGLEKDENKAKEIFQKSCDIHHHPASCHALGIMCENGRGGKKDDNSTLEAIAKYQLACEGGYVASCVRLGLFNLEGDIIRKNERRAAQLFRKACDNENLEGCMLLAYAYHDGKGRKKNIKKAAELYRKACVAGMHKSCVYLGNVYVAGKGVKKNLEEAKNLFESACENGEPDGCRALSDLYEDGIGVEKDKEKADSFSWKAMETRGFGNVAKDATAGILVGAAKSYEEECIKGDMIACKETAYRYEVGRGFAKDEKKALTLYKKACSAEVMSACTGLGKMHMFGLGTVKNIHYARKLFKKSCENGDMDGCIYLGVWYENGYGGQQNRSKAAEFYKKGCNAGEMWGCQNLGLIYRNGIGVGADDGQAAKYFQMACEGNFMISCRLLGWMYQNGQGMEKDATKANELFGKACDGGDGTACMSPCYVFQNEGLIEEAEACTDALIESLVANDRKDIVCEALVYKGQLLSEQGEFYKAMTVLDSAYNCAVVADSEVNKYWSLGAQGNIDVIVGNLDAAKEKYVKATKIAMDNEFSWILSGSWAQLGYIDFLQEQYSSAIAHYRRALSHAEKMNDEREANQFQMSLMAAYHKQGKTELTQDYLKSVAFFRNQNDIAQQAFVSHQLAGFSLAEGRPRETLAHISECLPVFRSKNTPLDLLSSLFMQGKALEALGQIEKAMASFDAAVAIADTLLDKVGGDAAQKGFREKLDATYEAPVRIRYKAIQSQSKDTQSNVIQQRRKEAFSIFELGRAQVMMHRMAQIGVQRYGWLPEPLTREEKSINDKIEGLMRKAANEDTQDVSGKGDVADAGQRKEKLDALLKKRQAFANKLWSNPETVAYAALNYPRPVAPKDIGLEDNEVLVEFMVGEQGVYRWILHKNALVAFDQLKISSKALGQEVNGILDLIKVGKRPQQAAHSLYKILLVDAMNFMPKENGRLIIVPDGILATLPFEYLNQKAGSAASDEQPIGLDYPIVYAPSARAIELARRSSIQNEDNFSRQLLAVGDPVYLPGADQRCGVKLDADDSNYCPSIDKSEYRALVEEARKLGLFHGSTKLAALLDKDRVRLERVETIESKVRGSDGYDRLCHTRNEVLEISQVFDENESDVLLDFEPTKTHIIKLLTDNRYETIHFSTHGVIPNADDDTRFAQPAIVLAVAPEEGSEAEESNEIDRLVTDEQLLTMKDIFESRIPAKQVTLSACHSGQGEQIKGEGVQGMGQAFLYAGAQTVVMSLWSVNDASTAEWMKVYYAAIQNGKDRAEAALEARKAIHSKSGFANNWSSPYYWAPFIVVGVEK